MKLVLGLLSVIPRTNTRSCLEKSGGGMTGWDIFGLASVFTGSDHWRAMARPTGGIVSSGGTDRIEVGLLRSLWRQYGMIVNDVRWLW